MKRTAVCFYGLVGSQSHKGGLGKPLNVELAGHFNLKNIINNNNADVFVHSWSFDSAEKINKFYSPVVSLVERQANVSFPWSFPFNRPKSEIVKLLAAPHRAKDKLRDWKLEAFRSRSRWLSCKKSIELMRNYESKHGFEYDAVLLTRLDVGFFKPFTFLDLDLNKFWASNWNNAPQQKGDQYCDFENLNTNFGFLDFWFLSNSSSMKRFSKLYDDMSKLSVSPHRSSFEYAKLLELDIGYCNYRWQDYEMVRRKFLDYDE